VLEVDRNAPARPEHLIAAGGEVAEVGPGELDVLPDLGREVPAGGQNVFEE
jgi:hypothetical protein